MAGIYAADCYCDNCVEQIKASIRADGAAPADPDDERSYDSGEYPKWMDDCEESDSPTHCAECEVFLENQLTADGYDYVADAIQGDLDAGNFDSIAVTLWAGFYGFGVVIGLDGRRRVRKIQ